jgi:hypothetical protein
MRIHGEGTSRANDAPKRSSWRLETASPLERISLAPFIRLALSETYPDKLEQFLRQRYPAQEIVVFNSGRGAEHTGQGAQRLPGVLDAEHPQVVLILEGINASWRSDGEPASGRHSLDDRRVAAARC